MICVTQPVDHDCPAPRPGAVTEDRKGGAEGWAHPDGDDTDSRYRGPGRLVPRQPERSGRATRDGDTYGSVTVARAAAR